MMPIGQFGVDSCHLDGGRAQCGLGGHQGGRQGGDSSCMGYLIWYAGELWSYICCWTCCWTPSPWLCFRQNLVKFNLYQRLYIFGILFLPHHTWVGNFNLDRWKSSAADASNFSSRNSWILQFLNFSLRGNSRHHVWFFTQSKMYLHGSYNNCWKSRQST